MAGVSGPASSDSIERSVLFDQVYACLSAVAPPETLQRDLTIFLLRYRQGLTVPQIASLPSIGLSIEGVESVLHRLMELLRTHLAETRPAKPSASEKAHGKGV